LRVFCNALCNLWRPSHIARCRRQVDWVDDVLLRMGGMPANYTPQESAEAITYERITLTARGRSVLESRRDPALFVCPPVLRRRPAAGFGTGLRTSHLLSGEFTATSMSTLPKSAIARQKLLEVGPRCMFSSSGASCQPPPAATFDRDSKTAKEARSRGTLACSSLSCSTRWFGVTRLPRPWSRNQSVRVGCATGIIQAIAFLGR